MRGGARLTSPIAASRLRRASCLLALTAALTPAPRAQALPEGGVDLHAHLSMKPALSFLFRGELNAPLAAQRWDDRLSSKINAEALDASGLSVVVVALFAHSVISGDMRAEVRDQIDEVEAFARAHPRWAIARDAAEARAILEAGRRVLVLSLEGAAGVLDTEEDLVEFVDRRGVRVVTPIHLVDDRYGGAATLGSFSYLGNPLGVASRIFADKRGIERSVRGLTPLGRRLIARLLGRGVWIDLTHASDAALAEIIPMVRAAGQPLLVTHAMLRRHRALERATSDDLLKAVAASSGVVGLLPSEDGFDAPEGRLCPAGCSAKACEHGVNAFAAVWADAVRAVGAEAVMLGSDHNGGVRHLAPSCGTGTALDQQAGLWNIGQSGALLEALERLGAPRAPLRVNLERFLSAWGRVRPWADRAATEALPSQRDVVGSSWQVTAMAGAMTSGRDAGALLSADLRARKETRVPLDAEPVVYFAHVRVEGAVTKDAARAPYLSFSLAPAGIVAASGHNLVEGEILPVSMDRRAALDEALVTRIEILRGRLRASPSALSKPGIFAPYLDLGADVLGYELFQHLSARASLSGLLLGGGSLDLGAVFGDREGFSVSLSGGGGADALLLRLQRSGEVGVLSQMFARAGVRVAERGGRYFQGFEAELLGVRESLVTPIWMTAPGYRGFVGAAF